MNLKSRKNSGARRITNERFEKRGRKIAKEWYYI